MGRLELTIRASLIACVLATPLLAQAPCAATGDPVAAGVPATQVPTSLLAFEVDARFGDDTLGAAGQAPFRTIGAAVQQASLWARLSADHAATINLRPGSYGPAAGMSGDVFPVVVPARVSIIGRDATSVIIRPQTFVMNSSGGLTLPTSRSSAPTPRVPAFIYAVPGPGGEGGYEHTLLARVTIVGADLGVLVAGPGEISPTIAQCAFVECAVGVQIDGSPGAHANQRHRPVLLWNTFGACIEGILATGTTQPSPAVVNCIIDAAAPLEGVPCNGVSQTVFVAGQANQSPHLAQPLGTPASTYDLSLHTRRDLYVGARVQDRLLPPQSFADWRLVPLTETGIVNPLLDLGRSDFPLQLGNGVWVRLPFPDFDLGASSAEGPGTRGLTGPLPPQGSSTTGGGALPGGNTGGAHVGYRGGGGFIVGGALPGERRFGTGPGGTVLYDRIHLFFSPNLSVVSLVGVVTPGEPYPGGFGPAAPQGMLEAPVMVPGLGASWLRPDAVWNDFGTYVQALTPANRAVVQVALPPVGTPAATYVLQGVAIDANTLALVTTDTQTFIIGGQ